MTLPVTAVTAARNLGLIAIAVAVADPNSPRCGAYARSAGNAAWNDESRLRQLPAIAACCRLLRRSRLRPCLAGNVKMGAYSRVKRAMVRRMPAQIGGMRCRF